MKTTHKKTPVLYRAAIHGRREDGFVATVMFIGLLAIMLMFATAGGMALIRLHDEVNVLERQQIKRLDLSVTNSAAISRVSLSKADTK